MMHVDLTKELKENRVLKGYGGGNGLAVLMDKRLHLI